MSQIQVDPEEFADIVLAFLKDSMREDLLEGNPRYEKFIDQLKKKGFKTHLLQHYLDMSSQTRVKYKRIRNTFDGGDSSRINIVTNSFDPNDPKGLKNKNKEKEGVVSKTIKTLKRSIGLKEEILMESNFDRDLCKRIFRKVKEVRFNKSMPISEEKLDKIIDYCIIEREEQNNG